MSLAVLHLCEADGGGGAMQAAYKLHCSLRTIGVTSQMLVGRKSSADSDVTEIVKSNDILSVLRRRVISRWNSRSVSKYNRTRMRGFGPFTTASGHLGAELAAQVPPSDVVNLHWMNTTLDIEKLLKAIGSNTPIVWRLPDMNAMTGGCHYSFTCERFTDSCGRCPQLGSLRENDLSRQVFLKKQRALANIEQDRLKIVAPSRWIAGQAQRSSLLESFEIVNIPTGVDTSQFTPRDKAFSKEIFGLPQKAPVVLFSAASVHEKRKGLDLLLSAVSDLSHGFGARFAVLGNSRQVDWEGNEVSVLGHLQGGRLLSVAYSCADIFVLPSRVDNLPNVVLEAMACGVPCVAFDVGGVSDLVRHEETGLLVPAEDVSGLRDAIDRLLADDALRHRLGRRARKVAEAEFSDRHVAARYKALYEGLVTASRSIRRPGEEA